MSRKFGLSFAWQSVRSFVWLLAIAIAFGLATGDSRASAGEGQATTTSTIGDPGVPNFQIEVDNYWVSSIGYRPVRIKISTNRASPNARKLRFSFFVPRSRTRNYFQNYNTVTVADVEFPANELRTEAVALVRYTDAVDTLRWDVSVDGFPVPRLGDSYYSSIRTSNSSDVAMLFSGNANTINPLAAKILQACELTPTLADISNGLALPRTSGEENCAMAFIDTNSLPTEWLGYSMLDAVVLPLDDAEKLVKSNPQAWNAILAWVRIGGAVYLVDPLQGVEERQRVERLLQLNLDKKGADTADVQDASMEEGENKHRVSPGEWARREWHVAREFDFAMTTYQAIDPTLDKMDEDHLVLPVHTDDAFVISQALGSGNTRSKVHQFQSLLRGKSKHQPPLVMPVQFGFAMLTSDRSLEIIMAVQRAESSNLRRLDFRYGGAFGNQTDEDLEAFEIPDLGAPPVRTFCILVTVLAILMGPVNYYFLRKFDRLYLLLFTAPLLAMLATTTLFAYAILGDGLGVRQRMESFTWIDQKSGKAASVARHAYYAGIAPSQGLTFSDQTCVMPIYTDDERNYVDANSVVDWQGDEQRLTEGWLVSRTLMQCLTLRSTETKAGLVIAEREDKLTLENQLGASILRLTLVDSNGRYFQAERIESGEQVNLKPLADASAATAHWNDVAERLKLVRLKNAPAHSQVSDLERSLAAEYFHIRDSTTLLNDWESSNNWLLLRRLRAAVDVEQLPTKTYLVELETPIIAERGYDTHDEESSLHLLFGTF